MNIVNKPIQLYFIRHGESEANRDGFFAGGVLDSPLTLTGVAQAQVAAKLIKADYPEIKYIISSTMLRTRQTTAVIAEECGISPDNIRFDPRLIEYKFAPEMIGSDKTPFQAMGTAVAELPGAENPIHFSDRVFAALQEVAAHWPPEQTLLIGHGGVERVITAKGQGLPPIELFNMPLTENAKLKKITL